MRNNVYRVIGRAALTVAGIQRPPSFKAYTNADSGNTFVLPIDREHNFIYFQPAGTDEFYQLHVTDKQGDHTFVIDNSHLNEVWVTLGEDGKLELEPQVKFGDIVYSMTNDNFMLDPERIVPHRYPGEA